MAIETSTVAVDIGDGTMSAHLVLPEGGRGPGLILLHEIFGVGAYVKAVADRLAALGYLVLAPDLFWRTNPGWAADHDDAGLQASLAQMADFDAQQAASDSVAALEWLRERPETGGKVGVIGFCLGGMLSYLVAAKGTPDIAVAYYGSGVGGMLDLVPQVSCPILFHYGEHDPYIPATEADAVRAAFAGRPDAAVSVQRDAGHAFDNHEATMFFVPDAAAAAWEQTVAFLYATLPPTAE